MEALVVCGIYAFALLKGAEAKHCVPLFLCMSSRHFVRSSVYFTTAHVVCDSQEPGSHRPSSPVDGAMQGRGRFQLQSPERTVRAGNLRYSGCAVDPDRVRDMTR